MSQLETLKNQQISDKVESAKNAVANDKLDTKEIMENASKVFKSLNDAAKNSKDVHHMTIDDDAHSQDYKNEGKAKWFEDAKKAVESTGGTKDHKLQGGKEPSEGGDLPYDASQVGKQLKGGSTSDAPSMQSDSNKNNGRSGDAKDLTPPIILEHAPIGN